jgi:hypothetical protein
MLHMGYFTLTQSSSSNYFLRSVVKNGKITIKPATNIIHTTNELAYFNSKIEEKEKYTHPAHLLNRSLRKRSITYICYGESPKTENVNIHR